MNTAHKTQLEVYNEEKSKIEAWKVGDVVSEGGKTLVIDEKIEHPGGWEPASVIMSGNDGCYLYSPFCGLSLI